jgi:hypothetical protein
MQANKKLLIVHGTNDTPRLDLLWCIQIALMGTEAAVV